MEQTLRFAFGIDVKSAGLQRDLGFRNSGDGGASFVDVEKVGLNRPGGPQTSKTRKGWLKQAWKGQDLE